MAIRFDQLLNPTQEDLSEADRLEKQIDAYLIASHPDLSYGRTVYLNITKPSNKAVEKELDHRYRQAGWKGGFKVQYDQRDGVWCELVG